MRNLFYCKVAGVTKNTRSGESRQLVIRRLLNSGQLEMEQELVLVPEPSNPYDPNAVRVCSKSGDDLGFIPAKVAPRISSGIKEGLHYTAYISRVTGGMGTYSYGINLRIIESDSVSAPVYNASTDVDTQKEGTHLKNNFDLTSNASFPTLSIPKDTPNADRYEGECVPLKLGTGVAIKSDSNDLEGISSVMVSHDIKSMDLSAANHDSKAFVVSKSIPDVKIGAFVVHKSFGEGYVTALDRSQQQIRVAFGDCEKAFVFPDVFKKGLMMMADEDYYGVCPSKVSFIKKMKIPGAYVFLCNSALFLYFLSDKRLIKLTKTNEDPKAFDIFQNSVFCLSLDQNDFTMSIIRFDVTVDHDITKTELMAEDAEGCSYGYDYGKRQVYDDFEEVPIDLRYVNGTLFISPNVYSGWHGMSRFDLQSHKFEEQEPPLSDYTLKEWAIDGDRLWAIATDDQNHEYLLNWCFGESVAQVVLEGYGISYLNVHTDMCLDGDSHKVSLVDFYIWNHNDNAWQHKVIIGDRPLDSKIYDFPLSSLTERAQDPYKDFSISFFQHRRHESTVIEWSWTAEQNIAAPSLAASFRSHRILLPQPIFQFCVIGKVIFVDCKKDDEDTL